MGVRIGDRVKERITGFVGIATGRTEYINGCRQFLVKHEKMKADGTYPDGIWLDEQTLSVVDSQVLPDPFLTSKAALAGGPDRHERAR